MSEPRSIRQLLTYVAVGAAGTLAQYAFLVTTVSLHWLTPVPASVCGAVLGAVVNYALNARFTFRAHSHAVAAPRFAAVALVGVVCTWASMKVCTEHLALNYLLAQCVASGLTLLVTYWLNSAWTFRQRMHHG